MVTGRPTGMCSSFAVLNSLLAFGVGIAHFPPPLVTGHLEAYAVVERQVRKRAVCGDAGDEQAE
jgi:hypothetical protein